MTSSPDPAFTVSDLALAKLAAQASIEQPGVARLAPRLSTVIRSTLTKAVRSLTGQSDAESDAGTAPEPADPGAVEIDHSDGDLTQITVRIIASGRPPVLQTVNAVQLAVHDAINTLTPLPIDVTVLVVDTEESDADHNIGQ